MREQLLRMLQETKSSFWVADQLEHTFAQGVSMTVKETKSDIEFFHLEPSGLSPREIKKRETYETTRAYTDEESMELIKEAFNALFVTLPSIQASAIKELKILGIDFSNIEFVQPDEPGREDIPHSLPSDIQEFSAESAKQRVEKFFKEIVR